MPKGKKSKGSKKPTHSRVENGRVILSDEREHTLSMIKDSKARAQLRGEWEADVLAKHEARQAYLASKDEYGLEVTGANMLRVKGTGGRWAHFTKEGADRLIADFASFKKLAAKLKPRVATPVVANDDESSDDE